MKSLENENENSVRDEARTALLDICNNLLRSPNDDKSRELRLDDHVVVEKLLPAVGAMECLFDIGYTEDVTGERIFLPHNASLSRLKTLSKLLSGSGNNSVIENITHRRPLTQNTFFKNIIWHFNDILHYEDPNLQRKARSFIPIAKLEIAAMTKLREVQKSLKLNDATTKSDSLQLETDLIMKDLFLLELLHWFKCDFFKWVNSPLCSICSTESEYDSEEPSADPRCSRIEIYRCTKCDVVIEFPRYTHPEPLLTLQRGRCGEWATVFTLFCRSLNYDARFIWDQTDHVWTEVWSVSNKRWIHVDSCEDVMDKPLMYEKGWKKKLSYILAFSKDEVQDVTWRYTSDQKTVMKRRTICAEQNLIHLLRTLSNQRQNSIGYSRARKEYVVKRNLLELAEMLYIPNSRNEDSDENYEGRLSGSLAWRLARNEISQTNVSKNHVWNVSKYGQTFELRYNIVKDTYQVVSNADILEEKSGWLERVNTVEGEIFRKVENDWKMVYLARSPHAKSGRIKWTFDVADSNLRLKTFSLTAKSEVFHGASVSSEIEAVFNDNKAIVIPVPNCGNFRTEDVKDAVRLNVIVTLSGGRGKDAWQHAQLFRQSLENTEEQSMIISIQLKNCCA